MNYICKFSKENPYKISEETKRKISETLKKKYKTGIIKPTSKKGRKWTKEQKDKLKAIKQNGIKVSFWKGKKLSLSTRQKMSKCRRKYDINSEEMPLDDENYRSWVKNRRNRVIKRLKVESLTHSFIEWEKLKEKYNFTCPCCLKKEPDIKLTVDHIIPLSLGGTDEIGNIQPLCKLCNFKKHIDIVKY